MYDDVFCGSITVRLHYLLHKNAHSFGVSWQQFVNPIEQFEFIMICLDFPPTWTLWMDVNETDFWLKDCWKMMDITHLSALGGIHQECFVVDWCVCQKRSRKWTIIEHIIGSMTKAQELQKWIRNPSQKRFRALWRKRTSIRSYCKDQKFEIPIRKIKNNEWTYQALFIKANK